MARTQMKLGVISGRPAMGLAAALILGILIHLVLPVSLGWVIVSMIALAVVSGIFISKSFLSSALLMTAVVLGGAGIAQREHFQFSPNDIGLFSSDEPQLAEVEVRLLDEPRIVTSELAETRHLPPKMAVDGEVLRVKTWEAWKAASGELPIVIDKIDARLNAGQVVRLAGMLQRPAPAASPGQFDWAWYYRQQRILTTMVVSRVGNISIVEDGSPSALGWLRVKAQHLLAIGFSERRAVEHAMLGALVLGERDPAMSNVAEELKATGVAYQLNVTGMHVAVFAGLVLLVCRFALLPPRWTLVICELCVLFYGVISMPTHSGIRWVILCSAVFLARWTRRSTDRFQLLTLCGAAMLVYHPMDLYSMGFQLSFVAILAMAIFMKPLVEFCNSLRDPHMVVAPQPIDRGWVRSVFAKIGLWIVGMTLMELVVWMAILPVLLYQQGQLNLLSMVAAFVVFPIVLVSLVGGWLKILCTVVWPTAAGIWAGIAGGALTFLERSVHLLARLPGGKIVIPAPRVWVIVVYYALCCLPLLPPLTVFRGRRRWVLRGGPVAAVLSMLILPGVVDRLKFALPSSDLRVTLLAVGAGQCAVIEPVKGGVSFVDAGSTSISDVFGKVVSPFLKSRGEREIDDIFLSHGDYDHISAAGEIATAYGAHEVLISPHFRRNAAGNLPDQELLEMLGKENETPREIREGDHLALPGEVAIDVLWPPGNGVWNSNNAGLVLRLKYRERTILFPADIQDPAFAALLNHPENLKADVLIAPHHGSSETLTAAFVRAVNPQIILSSNAWVLTSKQKRFDVIAEKIPLYRTSKFGAITISINPAGEISVSTFLKGNVQTAETTAALRR